METVITCAIIFKSQKFKELQYLLLKNNISWYSSLNRSNISCFLYVNSKSFDSIQKPDRIVLIVLTRVVSQTRIEPFFGIYKRSDSILRHFAINSVEQVGVKVVFMRMAICWKLKILDVAMRTPTGTQNSQKTILTTSHWWNKRSKWKCNKDVISQQMKPIPGLRHCVNLLLKRCNWGNCIKWLIFCTRSSW